MRYRLLALAAAFLAALLSASFVFAQQPAQATAAPSAPGGVNALTVGTTRIDLTWNKVTGATSYQVWRSTGKSSSYRKIATVKSAKYSNKSLKARTRYNYKVRAMAKTKASRYSRASSAYTAIPAGLAATAASTSEIDLSWDKLGGATSYQVWRSSGGSPAAKVATLSGQTRKDTGLASGTSYSYRIRAVVAGAQTGYSATRTATTQGTPAPNPTPNPSPGTLLPAPGHFSASTYNYQSVQLYYDTVQNAVTYRIYYATVASSNIADYSSFDFAGKDCRVIGLNAGTTYYFRVAAVDTLGRAGTPTGFVSAPTSSPPGNPPQPVFYLNGIDVVGSMYRMNFYRSTSPVYPSLYEPTFNFYVGTTSGNMTLDATADLSQYFYYDVAPGQSRWYGFTANYGPYASTRQTINVAALGQPATVSADGVTQHNGYVYMSWSSVPYASRYKIYYCSSGPYPGQSWFDFKVSAGSLLHYYSYYTGTSATLSGLPLSTQTYFFVVPADASGVEGWWVKYAISAVVNM